MAPGPQLAPPGSSSYSSNTLNVGDGTWDSQRNTFLLPNLVGLNFDTMRYNGMGNRFVNLPGYHSLIRGHGVIAAITFLFIVPAAIFIARFYDRRPNWAMRLHIWLQVLTVALSTVVFVLGWFAVGPQRSLTNPHHGIGLAIYIFILVQALGGWWVHGREKEKVRRRIPIKLMVHQWFGRMVALLGLAQIPLGLTLYGSPLALFVLYALALAILILTYFVLSYRHSPPIGFDHRGSVVSGSEVYEERRERRDHHGGRLGALAGVGAAGAGIAALNKLRNRSRSRARSRDRTDVVSSRRPSRSRISGTVGSRHPSGSYMEDEKHYHREHEGGGWGDRLLKIGAVGGAVALARNFMNKRNHREVVRHDGHNAGLSGPYSHSEESLSRVEQGLSPGRPSPGRGRPHQPNRLHRRSQSYSSISSRTSFTGAPRPEHSQGHNIRDGVATLGVFGLARAALKGRRERKEQKRIEELRQRDREQERLARQGSQRARYTGDGFPPRGGRRGSLTLSGLTSTDASSDLHPHPRFDHGVPPPIPAGVIPAGGAGAATAAAVSSHSHASTSGIPVPPTTNAAGGPMMPPIPPDTHGILHHDSASGSEAYTSASGRHHHRHHSGGDAAADAALGAAAAASSSRHHNRRHTGDSPSGTATPPMAVKVKLHNDNNRHVTLRRLTEEERIAEKEARRRARRDRHNASDLSATDPAAARWRRTEELERAQAEELRRNTAGNTNPNIISGGLTAPGTHVPAGYVPPPPPPRTPTHGGSGTYLPPPPPLPVSAGSTVGGGTGSVGSPGTVTDASTAGDPSARRQRRRAERAQQGGYSTVAGGAGVGGRGGYGVEYS